MAIIDELRKDNELKKTDEEMQWYYRADHLIDEVVSFLTEEVRCGIRNKKDVSCKGIICECMDVFGHRYSIGVPRYGDPSEWHSWTFYTEDVAQYMVEKLKDRIEKEFRPQRINVRYDSHKKGVFKVYKNYTVYVDVLIKCK